MPIIVSSANAAAKTQVDVSAPGPSRFCPSRSNVSGLGRSLVRIFGWTAVVRAIHQGRLNREPMCSYSLFSQVGIRCQQPTEPEPGHRCLFHVPGPTLGLNSNERTA
jgi:hypothetical protein